ncbi:MAG: PIN domain-containing protein [Methanothermobacter sp.]
MMAAQFNIDVVSQLQEIIPRSEYTVPSFIIKELKNIKGRSKGKNRLAASTALKIASMPPLKIKEIPMLEGELVDDALLRISKVIGTNDRELRKKARIKGIIIIYLRQRKYLAVDGYLKI